VEPRENNALLRDHRLMILNYRRFWNW